MSEADLTELARWFKSKGGDRRRLLRRYQAGRQKTEALNARKQVMVVSWVGFVLAGIWFDWLFGLVWFGLVFLFVCFSFCFALLSLALVLVLVWFGLVLFLFVFRFALLCSALLWFWCDWLCGLVWSWFGLVRFFALWFSFASPCFALPCKRAPPPCSVLNGMRGQMTEASNYYVVHPPATAAT